MATAIAVCNLTKEFVNFTGSQRVMAVDNLSMEIQEGELFGFLGPNGAGKTTTMKILLGILFPTSGYCEILGQKVATTAFLAPETNPTAIKRDVGYLPEGPYFHEFMTAEEVLRFYGRLYGMGGRTLTDRISQVLDEVGLAFAKKRVVKNYSKGMRQRLGLAQALLSDPKILVLDEPTTGLDPIARREIRETMIRLGEAGKTLLICSHELAEVELMCDRVGMINKGQLVREGRVVDLIYAGDRLELETKDLTDEARAAFTRNGCDISDEPGGLIRISLPESEGPDAAVQALKNANAPLLALRAKRRTLEDLFVETVQEANAA